MLAAASLPAWVTADAQSLALQRAFAPPLAAACAGAPTAARRVPDRPQRDEARRLGRTADVHLLAGELAPARDALRAAVALDPSSAELAFRLARTHEELGDARSAVNEYCRARALELPLAERAEAEERLRALATRLGVAPSDVAERSFAAGVARYESGDVAGAEAAFGAAIAASPAVAAAYYDRALARIRTGRVSGALADLDAFARLAPRQMTPALMDARVTLQRGRFSPAAAATAGLVPGGGQFYTRRPVAGALVALAAAGGLYLAFDGSPTERLVTAEDPFGNPYQYPDPNAGTAYPRRGVGLALVGLALVGGAAEGYLHAQAGQSALARLARAIARAAANTAAASR